MIRDRLISGSVGTVIYYGFQCNAAARSLFLSVCLINGLAGTVVPFWEWFDRSENKVILFFVLSPGQHPTDDVFCRNGASFSSLPRPS
jgi:hypothetical protein